jgi:hypothetical protein
MDQITHIVAETGVLAGLDTLLHPFTQRLRHGNSHGRHEQISLISLNHTMLEKMSKYISGQTGTMHLQVAITNID